MLSCITIALKSNEENKKNQANTYLQNLNTGNKKTEFFDKVDENNNA